MGEVLCCVERDSEQAQDVPLKPVPVYAAPQDQTQVPPLALGTQPQRNQQQYNPADHHVAFNAQPSTQSYLSPKLPPTASSGIYVPGSMSSGIYIPGSMSSIPGSSRSMMSSRWTASARANAKQTALEGIERLKAGNEKFVSGEFQVTALQSDNNGLTKAIAMICCCTSLPVPAHVIFGVDAAEIACTANASLLACSSDDSGPAALELAMSRQLEVAQILVLEVVGVNNSEDEATDRVWDAYERLIMNSKSISVAIKKQRMYIQAVLWYASTGKVSFLGEHPHHHHLISGSPILQKHRQRTVDFLERTTLPPTPPAEGVAILQCGNMRAHNRPVTTPRSTMTSMISPRGTAPDSEDPFAIIFYSFSPHNFEAPSIEVIFDSQAGKIHPICTVPLPNDGSEETYGGPASEDEQWMGHIHFTEHQLHTKAPRLLLVLGRVPQDEDAESVKQKVFNDMWKVIALSTIVKAGIADGRLNVEGAIYHGGMDTPPGIVEWLGAHPNQTGALAKMGSRASHHHDEPAKLTPPPPDHQNTHLLLQQLLIGNERFLSQGQRMAAAWTGANLANSAMSGSSPKILVIASSDGRDPETVFDTAPGELLVHRTCGAICGRRDGCAMHCVEDLLKTNESLCTLLLLIDSCDPAIAIAMDQVQRCADPLKYPNAQAALEQLMPACVQVRRDSYANSPQQDLYVQAAKFQAIYVMERIHLGSHVVTDLVAAGRLQVQAAIIAYDGSVELMGGHREVDRLIEQKRKELKHNKKNVGLDVARR